MNVITFEVWDYKHLCRALLEMYYEDEYEVPFELVTFYTSPALIGPKCKEPVFFHYN